MTHAHFLVAKTAQEMAASLFEDLAQDNYRFTTWKNEFPGESTEKLRKRFVKMAAPTLVPLARATLAKMLSGPLDEVLKKQIASALIKDNVFQESRKAKASGRE